MLHIGHIGHACVEFRRNGKFITDLAGRHKKV